MKKLGLWIALITMAFSANVYASLEIVITEGVDSARPIGVVPFKWKGQGSMPGDISKVVMADLMRSGKFNPVSVDKMPQFPETAEQVSYTAWATLGVDTVLVGSIEPQGGDRFLVSYELIDVLKGQVDNGQAKVLKNGSLVSSNNHVLAARQAVINGRDFRQ
jgi:TolB protein